MIVVTGAAGFIGSCLVSKLNREGFRDIVVVDDFSREEKVKNLQGKSFSEQVHRDVFWQWLKENHRLVQFVFHLGARTDTAEFDKRIFDRLNLNFSKNIWTACVEFGLPLVYGSSAATYGSGEHGYDDSHELVKKLRPLNPYGKSKNEFDKWALAQEKKPDFWAGIKFFNVYGPNEYHKGRMASVAFHAFNQINQTGKVKLFRSHHPAYKDGEQLRDFVYVKDAVNVLYWFLLNREHSGIYNLGSGTARTFSDLANSVFAALGKDPDIEFIDTPLDIRDRYQYFTEAKMEKLKRTAQAPKFFSLEKGIEDYVRNYLLKGKFL